MVAFNLPGLVLLIVAGAVAQTGRLLGAPLSISAPVGVGLMVCLDLAYRYRSSTTGRRKWLSSDAGGFLGVGPTWIFGLIMLALLPLGIVDF